MSQSNLYKIEEFLSVDEYKHPFETSRFILALLVIIFLALVLVVSSILSFLIVPLVLLGIGLMVYFFLRLMRAMLIGNAVRVSEDNFPEVHQLVLDARTRLNYNKEIDVYIIEKGSYNAFLYKFFGCRMVVLNAGMLKDFEQAHVQQENFWLIARFVGYLKAKHDRLELFKLFFETTENLPFLNLFLWPYERAVVYSGDQIAFGVINHNINACMNAMSKMLVGTDLSKSVRTDGLINQAYEQKQSFFGWFSEVFILSMPHTTNRFLNLLAFARFKCPDAYADYLRKMDKKQIHKLESILPSSYPNPGKIIPILHDPTIGAGR